MAGMSEQRAERCETCRFWEPEKTEVSRVPGVCGTCHRNAPVALPIMVFPEGENTNEFMAVWPETTLSSWCGEYQPVPLPVVETCQPVKILNPSVCLKKSLEKWGIKTVHELTALNVSDLIDLVGSTKLMIREIRDKLAAHGLKLRGDP
jgi:hypothetical protein